MIKIKSMIKIIRNSFAGIMLWHNYESIVRKTILMIKTRFFSVIDTACREDEKIKVFEKSEII